MKIFQKTIALDFDGTISSADNLGNGSIPEPRKNAIPVIRRWFDEGYVIIINTLRDGRHWERDARAYLDKHGIPFHFFNDNAPDRIAEYGDSRKMAADIYIDDRNLFGIPEDFEDIDIAVKKQIGLPYRNLDDVHNVKPEGVGAARRDQSPVFNTPWSTEFMSKVHSNNLYNAIYNEVVRGYVTPFKMVEVLAGRLFETTEELIYMKQLFSPIGKG